MMMDYALTLKCDYESFRIFVLMHESGQFPSWMVAYYHSLYNEEALQYEYFIEFIRVYKLLKHPFYMIYSLKDILTHTGHKNIEEELYRLFTFDHGVLGTDVFKEKAYRYLIKKYECQALESIQQREKMLPF